MNSECFIDYSLYEVKENGVVISKLYDREMKMHLTNNGYVQNTYKHTDGKPYKHYRHRVVWYYFNGEVPENMEIDHVDGDKTNNSLSNLRIVSRKDNMLNPNTFPKLLEALRSRERRKKISERLTGRVASEEQKRKQSIAMSGRKHPFYGKKRPDHSAKMKLMERDGSGKFIKKGGN